jgi:hypothetical protein
LADARSTTLRGEVSPPTGKARPRSGSNSLFVANRAVNFCSSSRLHAATLLRSVASVAIPRTTRRYGCKNTRTLASSRSKCIWLPNWVVFGCAACFCESGTCKNKFRPELTSGSHLCQSFGVSVTDLSPAGDSHGVPAGQLEARRPAGSGGQTRPEAHYVVLQDEAAGLYAARGQSGRLNSDRRWKYSASRSE